jgi:hypothetical protein
MAAEERKVDGVPEPVSDEALDIIGYVRTPCNAVFDGSLDDPCGYSHRGLLKISYRRVDEAAFDILLDGVVG